jgi:hypothetical protein
MERLDITQIGEWLKENGLGVYETKFAGKLSHCH